MFLIPPRFDFDALPVSRHPVMDYRLDGSDSMSIDLSNANEELAQIDLYDTAALETYVANQLDDSEKNYAIGGYAETRSWYARGGHRFTNDHEEVRSLHLGVDIWCKPGLPVYAPLDGIIHSFGDNDNFGDYGPTLILQHSGLASPFCTLYGHLSRTSLSLWHERKTIQAGDVIGWIGKPFENGSWPSHLHIQVVRDMGAWRGDYPGVAYSKDRFSALANSPDPSPLLGIKKKEAVERLKTTGEGVRRFRPPLASLVR